MGGLLFVNQYPEEKTYTLGYDGNGNVVGLFDMEADGVMAAYYEYGPFGETLVALGSYSGTNPVRWSTKYEDQENGFSYYGFRYYNSEMGRWLNRDPMDESGGWNLYSFVINSPLDYYDPLGKVAINDIPRIMIANGWIKGAALMNHWFAGSGVSDKRTITMAWALGYSRAKAVYDEIITKKLYANEAVKKEVIKLIKKVPATGGGPVKFGSVTGDPETLHSDHIQFRPVGATSDPVDDMYAALGRFTFCVLVEGYAYVDSGKVSCAAINKVGVYIYDSYDFSGSQPLGFWNSATNYGGKNPLKGDYVGNSDFRTLGTGRDFKVFSDIKETNLSPKEYFNE